MAEQIVVTEAIDSRAEWQQFHSTRAIVTRVTFRVTNTLKGREAMLLPLDFLGGSVGPVQQDVADMPTFAVGDRAVLFVSGESTASPIVGHMEGWFPITTLPTGAEHVTLYDGRAFATVPQIGTPLTVSSAPVTTMSLEVFLTEVKRLAFEQSLDPTAPMPSPTRPGEAVSEADHLPGRHHQNLYDFLPASIPFPPRNQPMSFFLDLEDTYRDLLGRAENNEGFVNAEGSAVWFPEWLRYVLNQCSSTESTNRVLMQIRGEGIQPVCGEVPEGVINFPPRNESLDFLYALDAFYRDELLRTVLLSHIDLEGKAVWLQEYLRYRVNGCGHSVAQSKVISQISTGVISPICGPKTTFGAGTYRVGTATDYILPGRYFTNPGYGCYWKRLSGFSGSLSDIIANEFIGFNAGQEIVDILATDYGFNTDADCGTWYDSPRSGGSSSSISPGRWLVGSQVTPGEYFANVSYGCYWERVRDFEGRLRSIIDNDFVSYAGPQYVTVRSSDVGFYTDDDCGIWTRGGAASATPEQEP